jgi:uncharacterized repeat protein (TIGR03837 family)
MPPHRVWDIFCTVIDNHGDLGVCWRLAADLASRGQQVRLWVDDASALAWMAPQGCPGVQVRRWADAQVMAEAPEPATDVLIEAFGCEIPEAFVAAAVQSHASQAPPVWINLEYLSAEPYVERSHGLPSPVMSGPARGWTKRFFYPGFTQCTGGLLRERDLAERQHGFDAGQWRATHGAQGDAFHVSLFCYDPPALPQLLAHWEAHGHHGRPVWLWVTAGRAAAAVRTWLAERQATGFMNPVFLPYLSQRDFDHLLWACDLNLVRGEDSVVRAIWAGKPLVWQLYPQDDGAHGPKLQAFLDEVGATQAARQWHSNWNPLDCGSPVPAWPYPDTRAWQEWQAQAQTCREALGAQEDLATQLIGFIAKSG